MPSRRSDPGEGEVKSNAALLGWFYLVIFLLSVIGLVNVYSATFYMNMENGMSPYYHAARHAAYLAAGVAGLLVCYKLPLPVIRRWKGALTVPIFFLFALVIVAGPVINGAQRWVQIGPLSLQPSELAKVVSILWAAACLTDRVEAGRPVSFLAGCMHYLFHQPFHGHIQKWTDVADGYVPLLIPAAFAAIVILQPDMGTAALILGFPIFLYVLCGTPWSDVLWSGILALLGLFILAYIEPYRWERVMALFDPFRYASDQGYQVVQSLIAVGSGGLTGQGAGEGLSKFLYLPEQYTDFAFAVLSQEGGFLASGFVLTLFVCLLYLGFIMAGRIPRLYPALVVYGLSMLIAVEGFLNMAMVVGIFPVTGVPLPFISFGGTSLVTNLCAAGLIGNAVRYGERARAQDERKRKLAALAGEPVSLRKLSGAVFQPPPSPWERNH